MPEKIRESGEITISYQNFIALRNSRLEKVVITVKAKDSTRQALIESLDFFPIPRV